MALQRTLKQLSTQSGQNLTIDDARRMGVDRTVLDNLIATASVEAAATKLGLAVSNTTVLQSLVENKMFQDVNGKFDSAIFKRLLEQNSLSESDFLATEKAGRLRSMLTTTADGSVKLPKTLSAALAQYRGESRDVKYFDFTVSEADVPVATDAEIKKQYEATPAAYTAPEYRSIAVLKIEPSDIADRLTVSPDELKAGYEQYKTDYFTPEKRTVLQLTFSTLDAAKKAKDRIAAGEDFVKIATELKVKESDYSLVDRQRGDFLDAKIGDAAFKLAQGAVSNPVQGELAIALLKAITIVPEKQSTLDEVKVALTSRLQLEKAKEEITAIYTEVEDARSQQTPFEKIAEKGKLPFKLYGAVNATGQDRAGKDVDMTSRDDVVKAAFLSDVGNSDDALAVGDGYVWYEVREVIPPGLKPLTDVKVEVSKDVMATKLRDAAEAKAKGFLAEVKSGATLDALSVKAAAIVKTATGLKRNETSQDFDGASVVSVYSVGDQGFAWSLAGDGKTARVMQITKITLPAVMATSPELTKLQDEASLGLSRDIGDSFVGALRKAADVTINEELWKQNTGTDIGQN